jgi:hypothetical protein
MLAAGCIDIPVSDSRYPDGGYRDDGYRAYPDYDETQYEQEHRHFPCSQLEERIRFDKDKIATTDPSKHHKALQWFKDDLENARRDRERCRDERDDRGGWDRERDRERERDRDRDRDRDRAREQERERQNQQERARAECDKIRDRIRNDQHQVATIDVSKHHKAQQWFKDDLRNAERDLQQKCGGR